VLYVILEQFGKYLTCGVAGLLAPYNFAADVIDEGTDDFCQLCWVGFFHGESARQPNQIGLVCPACVSFLGAPGQMPQLAFPSM
jgi:hypothetical protein